MQMSEKLATFCSTINFTLLQLFYLIYVMVNIQNVSCGSNAGMETSVPLVNGIVSNALHYELYCVKWDV